MSTGHAATAEIKDEEARRLAREALQRMDGHERLCEERYESLRTAQRESKADHAALRGEMASGFASLRSQIESEMTALHSRISATKTDTQTQKGDTLKMWLKAAGAVIAVMLAIIGWQYSKMN